MAAAGASCYDELGSVQGELLLLRRRFRC
jgi:hypothetical protein